MKLSSEPRYRFAHFYTAGAEKRAYASHVRAHRVAIKLHRDHDRVSRYHVRGINYNYLFNYLSPSGVGVRLCKRAVNVAFLKEIAKPLGDKSSRLTISRASPWNLSTRGHCRLTHAYRRRWRISLLNPRLLKRATSQR